MSKAIVPIGSSIVLHAGIAALMAVVSIRRPPAPQQALQVAVIETAAPKPAPPPPPPPPPKAEPQKIVPSRPKFARAPRTDVLPPVVTQAPPPPTSEARETTPEPVVITGITMESTTQGGSFAVGVGNTLQGTPERVAKAPEEVKPYKAEKYAPAAAVTELPRPLNGESVNLRKYYPPEAMKQGFEGDVVLRLLIDADGSVAKVDIVSDPGLGLGPAAAKMVRAEYRFAPATVNGQPVATTVPFIVHFTLN